MTVDLEGRWSRHQALLADGHPEVAATYAQCIADVRGLRDEWVAWSRRASLYYGAAFEISVYDRCVGGLTELVGPPAPPPPAPERIPVTVLFTCIEHGDIGDAFIHPGCPGGCSCSCLACRRASHKNKSFTCIEHGSVAAAYCHPGCPGDCPCACRTCRVATWKALEPHRRRLLRVLRRHELSLVLRTFR